MSQAGHGLANRNPCARLHPNATRVAAAKSFDDLVGDNAEWWHAFWQQGTIALHSADGVADWLVPEVGTWSVGLVAGQLRYNGTGPAGLGVSLVDLGKPVAYDSYLGLDAVVRAGTLE